MKELSIEKIEMVSGGWNLPSVMDLVVGSHCAGAVVAGSFGIVPLAVILGSSCVVGLHGLANGNLE
jgi:hypothetical protein